MSPEYIVALQTLDRSDILFRDVTLNPWNRVIRRELCVQPNGTLALHTFSDDPEDRDNFDVEHLDGVQLVAWLRDHWSDDEARLSELREAR
jgi:hypothetical protein